MHVRLVAGLLALPILGSGPALAEPPSAAEVEEANAGLDRTSPDYVRCKREDVIGYRAKKKRICRTNAEWERLARGGNDLARDTIDRSTSIYRDPSMGP